MSSDSSQIGTRVQGPAEKRNKSQKGRGGLEQARLIPDGPEAAGQMEKLLCSFLSQVPLMCL